MTETEIREKIALELEALYFAAKENYPEVEGQSHMPKDIRKAYVDSILTVRGLTVRGAL
jgi:hypothetical protein